MAATVLTNILLYGDNSKRKGQGRDPTTTLREFIGLDELSAEDQTSSSNGEWQVPIVDEEELNKLVDSSSAVLLDVRGSVEYEAW